MSVRAEKNHSSSVFMKRELRNAALIMAGLGLLVYGRSLIGNMLVGGADVVRSAYPIRHHFWSIIQRGELPTWSPYLLGGYPIIVEEQASLFYPPEWVFGLARSPAAYNFMIGFHTWLAGFGAYVLVRKLYMTRLASWMVAVAAMFGAPLVARVAAGHPSHFYGRTLMIWALVAILFLAENPNWWSALGLAAVFGAQLVIGIGNYQTALYTGLVTILFGVFALVNRVAQSQRRGYVAWGLIALVVAVGLGACRAGVTLEVGLQSQRQSGLSEDSLNYGALPPIMLSGYFLPHTFDDPSISDYTWPEFALYVGSAPFVMALYGIHKRWRESAVQCWIVITFLFMALSLGNQGGLFPLFVKYFPGYQLFRNPARHGMVASLGVAMLAGYGLDAIVGSLKKTVGGSRLRHTQFWIVGIAIGLLVLFFAATYQEPNGSSLDVLPHRLTRGVIWFAAAFILFFLAYRMHDASPTMPFAILLVGVIAFDLVLYAYPQIYQESEPADLPYLIPENFPDADQYSVAFLERGDPDDWGIVNVAADNGLRLLNMYTGVIPLRMTRVINILAGRPASERQEENQILFDAIVRPDLLDYLGVRYLLVNPSQQLDHDPSLQEGHTFGRVRSFENMDAKPFAFVVPRITSVSSPDEALESVEHAQDLRLEAVVVEGTINNRETSCPESRVGMDHVSNIRLEGGNIWFDIDSSQAGMLIINQTFQNGWKGWIEGEPSPVYVVNYRWMGMYLPCPGHYQIHVRYLPTSFTVGLLISSATLLFIVVISLVLLSRSHSRRY